MSVLHPVNLHPVFLFWKHGLVCDPEKSQVQNMVLKKSKKEKRPGFFFSFWITMTLFFRSISWTWFFWVPDPKKISGRPDKLELGLTRIVGADWLGAYVLSSYLQVFTKLFWTARIVLNDNKSFWTGANHFGWVQRRVFWIAFFIIWTCLKWFGDVQILDSKTNWICPKWLLPHLEIVEHLGAKCF